MAQLQAFVQKWSLGDAAQALLMGCDLATRNKIMMEFSPRDCSTDVNNVFLKFASNVTKGQGKGAGRPSSGLMLTNGPGGPLPALGNGGAYGPARGGCAFGAQQLAVVPVQPQVAVAW